MSAGEVDLRKLDSSVKRNSALVKKLRQVGDESRQTLLEDIAKTNQSKVRLCPDSTRSHTHSSKPSAVLVLLHVAEPKQRWVLRI